MKAAAADISRSQIHNTQRLFHSTKYSTVTFKWRQLGIGLII